MKTKYKKFDDIEDEFKSFFTASAFTDQTNLPFVIWIVQNINNELDFLPELKVNRKYSKNLVNQKQFDWFTVTIEDTPKVIGDTGMISSIDIQKLKDWILWNKSVLLDYWNEKLFIDTLVFHTNEMANLRKSLTGLPMNIFIGNGTKKHSPRIKVQTNNSQYFEKHNLVSMSLTIKDASGKYVFFENHGIKLKDIELLNEFVNLNLEFLIKSYNGEEGDIGLEIKPLMLKEHFESSNLYDKFMLLEAAQAKQVVSGIQWAVDSGIDAILIGGTAVVHYLQGGRTLTPDADFLVSDIKALKKKLDEDNIRFDTIVGVDGEVIGVTAIDHNTDFLDPMKGNRSLNRAILATSSTAKVADRNVRIIAPELLTILKLDLGREKDVADGFALLVSGKLDKQKFNHFIEALRPSLQDGQAIAAYSDLIP